MGYCLELYILYHYHYHYHIIYLAILYTCMQTSNRGTNQDDDDSGDGHGTKCNSGLNRVLHHHLTLTFDICLALLYNNNNNTTNQRVDRVTGRMLVIQFDSMDGWLHVLHTGG
jgi:hypothetical protein